MKTLKLMVAGLSLFLAGSLQAQTTINVSIGSPPLWGPVGYAEARYYYLPDLEAYYDIQSSNFIYYENGRWIHKAHLPYQHRGYDLYHGYKVVLTDYHGNDPYSHFKEHKVKYVKGYRGHEQKTIGERPGKNRYKAKYQSKNESQHRKGNTAKRGHDKNKGKGKRK
ncbi:MAG: hypothetical protein CO098_05960 [Bacteroidetes bacterium CG_4_9_14_3_um_filter_41_19]|nr:MAG: hypothetical protein CO098_05960 [Bacteroidetes bacterium CG_4_9_14_3_um_filter_41_19]